MDKNVSAIESLQRIIQLEKAAERFQAHIYDIESAALNEYCDAKSDDEARLVDSIGSGNLSGLTLLI